MAGLASRVAGAIGGLLALPFLDVAVRPRHAFRRARLVRDPNSGHLLRVHEMAMVQSTLIHDDAGWRLEIPYRSGVEELLGEDPLVLSSIRDYPAFGFFRGNHLLDGLGRVLPSLERGRPRPPAVAEATRLLERTLGSSEELLSYVTGSPLRYHAKGEFPLAHVPSEVRLALEMASHEEGERRALAGELKLLEREWRDAERLAKIADGLALEGS